MRPDSFRVLMLSLSTLMCIPAFSQKDSTALDTTLWYNQTKQLDEVVIKSPLPKTRVKGDAMRTIVAGSILEKAGTVSDALSRIPMLEATRDGAVKVLGRGEAELYINGRKVLDTKELSRLRADQIQYIDVVQNPGARYSSSTKAVVRITLKKNKGEGFSFQDYATGMYQYGHTLTNSLDVNYRTGGLDITAQFWAGRYGHGKSQQENTMTYNVGPDFVQSLSTQEMKSVWKGWSPQLQVNYMVNENHSFGAFYKFDRHPGENHNGLLKTDNYINNVLSEHSVSDIWADERFKKHIFNAYYNGRVGQLGIDFNVDGLFDDSESPSRTIETTSRPSGITAESTITSNTKKGNNFWATKLILSYPVLKGNLSVGGEYSYNHRTDAYDFTSTDIVPVRTTDTKIKEKSSAVFAEYGHQFGKLFAQVGMRYEHLKNDYFNFGKREDEVCRNYGDWFPSLVLSMPVGNLQLSLSYRRDIERPYYSSLTSSTIYINRYSYQSGNPYLRPMYTHSIVFNGAYKWANLTVNYQRIKDATTMVTEPYPGSPDPLVSLVHPVNTKDVYNRLMISASARPVIGIWHPTWSTYMMVQDYKTPTASGKELTLNRPFFGITWQNDIELPKNWRLNAMANFQSKGDMNNYRVNRAMFSTTLGVQHDVNLKALGSLTFDVRCYDVFNGNTTDATIYGTRDLTVHNPARRTFVLDLTWKFNEAQSKYRGSGAGSKQKARM